MKKTIPIVLLCLVFLLSAAFSFGSLQQVKNKQEPKAEKQEEEKPEEKKPPEKKEKTFEDVIKDAKKMEGLFNLYMKEDKLYLEILPDQFGKKYLFIPTLWTSVYYGGAGYYLSDKVFSWEKLDKKVLLVWKNTRYTAEKSPQYKRSLKNVVPESIVHAFTIESEPHTERKSILVSLDDMFLSDLMNLGADYSSQQNPYAVDKSRTVWGKIQAFPKNIELEVRYTLTSAKPRFDPSVPDQRLFTSHVRYSISEVPVNNGYKPRLADDRMGYFTTKINDFDKLDLDGTTVRYINRWYLEKKNPDAAISEPKEPIVFWLENTIPLEFREPIRDGVLEWNKAFEKAGFKNAIVVKQMPDDAEWDPADIRYNTIRWVASLYGVGGWAFGPSRVNPYTGQILDADVVIAAPLNFILSYAVFESPLDAFFSDGQRKMLSGRTSLWYQDNMMLGFQRDYGILDMLIHGKIKNIQEVPKEYMYDFFKYLGCHEVGHTLALRHNFKGSTTIALENLHNTKVTEKESIGNSIMEYLPTNLAPKGVKQGDYRQKTIGAWDYWVIEYGYKSLDAQSPDEELRELEKIASRSNEPELIYGADEDAYDFGPLSISIDPICTTFDLSDDPLGYSLQEVQRTKDLWKQLEERSLFEGKSYVYLRASFEYTLRIYFQAMARLVKWIGGIYHIRAHVGDPGDALPFDVVEYEKQQQAFDIIKANLLTPDAFEFEPEFIQKLQIDRHFDFDEIEQLREAISQGRFRLDFSLASHIKRFYQNILRMLYDPMRLHRIQDNEIRTIGKKLKLADYLNELFEAIWQELKEGKTINPFRRILQREYLNQVTGFVLKPSPTTPDDMIAVCRLQLKKLGESIGKYMAANPDMDMMTQAHLELCADIIDETLKAVITKTK